MGIDGVIDGVLDIDGVIDGVLDIDGVVVLDGVGDGVLGHTISSPTLKFKINVEPKYIAGG